MPSTNGHGLERAILYVILYARVSTEEQARSGYSLAQQLEALREYAVSEGYEVLEEIADPGQSGASLERPGMDRVRDLVAAGGASVVLAQDRDRFAREPAYHYLLRKEFEEHGCKIRALNDRGDDSPEGELTDGILDQLAKFERAKFTERSRRNKYKKVRQGKLLAAAPRPRFGFRFNECRDGYEVDENKMPVVRRIFRMVGEEGASLHGVQAALEREGTPSPSGGRRWSRTTVRGIIQDDCYRPHRFEELEALVAPEVAASLDPDKWYGISWWGKHKTSAKQVAENGPEGKRYRVKRKAVLKPREEWVAVPVVGSGIPQEAVDAARIAIKDNKPTSSAGDRVWELSGGLLVCGGCGRRMAAESRRRGPGGWHIYYRCTTRRGVLECPRRKNLRAAETEEMVWAFVSGLLEDPERLREDLERMIEKERDGVRGDPEREAKVWLDRLAEVDHKRTRYQDMAAEGLVSFEELRAKLAEFEETREAAKRELDNLEDSRERIARLERDKEGLLESYARMAPGALDALAPEERHHLYRILRLKVVAHLDGTLEADGAFGAVENVRELERTCS